MKFLSFHTQKKEKRLKNYLGEDKRKTFRHILPIACEERKNK